MPKRSHAGDKLEEYPATAADHDLETGGMVPSNLIFTLEYMKGVAAWKHPKCEYIGLSYEGDRPAFELEVPDGGRGVLHFFQISL